MTPETVERLMPHLSDYPRGSPEARAWGQLMGQGKVPHRRLCWHAYGVGSVAAEVVEHTDDGPAAAAFVTVCLDEHGQGPTWGELREGLSWSRPATTPLMRRLEREGWVTATLERRSLRPGPLSTRQLPEPAKRLRGDGL